MGVTCFCVLSPTEFVREVLGLVELGVEVKFLVASCCGGYFAAGYVIEKYVIRYLEKLNNT